MMLKIITLPSPKRTNTDLSDLSEDDRKAKARQITQGILYGNPNLRLPCCVCGRVDSEAHHVDYMKPLLVSFLCPVHHKDCHRKPPEEKKSARITANIPVESSSKIKAIARANNRTYSEQIAIVIEKFNEKHDDEGNLINVL